MKKKVCFIATIDWSVKWFLLEHIKKLSSEYDITVITNTKDIYFLKPFGVDLPVIPVYFERNISIWKDIKTFFQLVNLFNGMKFDTVHSISPKSGLLAMTAGFFSGVPIRVHTYTGQVWVTQTGIMRRVLKLMDKLIAVFATNLLVDSYSQKDFLVKEEIILKDKASVLNKGSVCGVDSKRFSLNPMVRMNLRTQNLISETDIVFLFLGRYKRDKGVMDLMKAFNKVCNKYNNVHLFVVGPDEENIKPEMIGLCHSCIDKIHFENFTDVPEHYMAAADVLCLPSYREGFGSVIIEAAAVGIPSIGTRIYGITDAIEEGVTGLLYEAKNTDEFCNKMVEFIEYPDLRKKMGENARTRVLRDFTKEIVTKAFLDYYRSL